jgi:hypothetical protein
MTRRSLAKVPLGGEEFPKTLCFFVQFSHFPCQFLFMHLISVCIFDPEFLFVQAFWHYPVSDWTCVFRVVASHFRSYTSSENNLYTSEKQTYSQSVISYSQSAFPFVHKVPAALFVHLFQILVSSTVLYLPKYISKALGTQGTLFISLFH